MAMNVAPNNVIPFILQEYLVKKCRVQNFPLLTNIRRHEPIFSCLFLFGRFERVNAVMSFLNYSILCCFGLLVKLEVPLHVKLGSKRPLG